MRHSLRLEDRSCTDGRAHANGETFRNNTVRSTPPPRRDVPWMTENKLQPLPVPGTKEEASA